MTIAKPTRTIIRPHSPRPDPPGPAPLILQLQPPPVFLLPP